LGLRKIRTASSVGKRGHERCRKPACTGLKRAITFVKEGARPFSIKSSKLNLLQNTRSWEMRVDVGKRRELPEVNSCGV